MAEEADAAYYLTAADRDVLRALLARENARRLGETRDSTFPDDQEEPASEVYVSVAPAGGIPALAQGATGTSDAALSDDVPGSAYCDVWRLLGVGTGVTLRRLGSRKLLVYNMNTTAVPAGNWVTVHKEKFGHWLVGGSLGSNDVRRGKVVSRDGDGQYTVVQVERSGGAWVAVGDNVPRCFRLPTEDDSPPPVPVGQSCLFGPDVEDYWMTPWGGQLKKTLTLVRAVYCDAGNLVTVVRDWDHSARDNCWRHASG